MENFIIPDLKKIKKNTTIWKPGFIPTDNGQEPRALSQSTIPNDKLILHKLGIKKGEKILSIASNHGDWAKALQGAGCIVDYNEYSPFFIKYVKKRIKFHKFIRANFIDIPKRTLQYDWTFSYEPVAGRRSLPLAMIRSLLNKKGAIIMYYNQSQSGKAKNFPKMVRMIAKTYQINYAIKSAHINALYFDNKLAKNKFIIFLLKTNNKARKKAAKDLRVLKEGVNRKTIKNRIDSIERLNKLSTLFRDIFLKKIMI